MPISADFAGLWFCLVCQVGHGCDIVQFKWLARWLRWLRSLRWYVLRVGVELKSGRGVDESVRDGYVDPER